MNKEIIEMEYQYENDFGRKIYYAPKNSIHYKYTNNEIIKYAFVNGKLYYTSRDGEPESPVMFVYIIDGIKGNYELYSI